MQAAPAAAEVWGRPETALPRVQSTRAQGVAASPTAPLRSSYTANVAVTPESSVHAWDRQRHRHRQQSPLGGSTNPHRLGSLRRDQRPCQTRWLTETSVQPLHHCPRLPCPTAPLQCLVSRCCARPLCPAVVPAPLYGRRRAADRRESSAARL